MANNQKRQSLIAVMNGIYDDLTALEREHGLFVGDGDLRPRIDYFHDVVRLSTDNPDRVYDEHSRLSVEHLAYDLSCLRYLMDHPVAPLGHIKEVRIPKAEVKEKQAVVERAPQYASVPPKTRADIAEKYKNYTVLFAALFAETADMNFHSRVEENNAEVEALAHAQHVLSEIMQGQLTEAEVQVALEHVHDEEIKTQLMAALHERGKQKRARANAVHHWLQGQMDGVDQMTAQINGAHTEFLSGQMMLYQDSKIMVQHLAAQGLNLAGQHLENAMNQSMGRGQGRF